MKAEHESKLTLYHDLFNVYDEYSRESLQRIGDIVLYYQYDIAQLSSPYDKLIWYDCNKGCRIE